MSAATEQHPIELNSALPLIQGLTRLHDRVALLDPKGRVVWLSDALASTCGGGRSFKGTDWLQTVVCTDDPDELMTTLETEGRISNQVVRLREKSGELLPVSVSAARISPSCGAIVAIFRHLDDHRPALRSTLRYLAAVLDSSPDGVIVIDRSRFITYANPAMEEITGWDVASLVDRPLAVFLRAQEDLEQIAGALADAPRVRNVELALRRRDGAPLEVSVSVSRLALEDGTQVGAVAHVQDITERRRSERDLARKNDELEHYVHTVSHDLRSPLVSILGFSRLLREDFAPALGEKGEHFLRRIEEAGRTMESLIHDLLELSQVGSHPGVPERVDPREVLMQLQAELKPRLDEQRVNLRLPVDPPMIGCERTRLYQVFSNLIGNALIHMGDVADPVIEVRVEERDGVIHIAVSDNGSGIDPKDHDRIFEIFKSVNGHSASRPGSSGVGLAIVKKIAELRGGRAWVESALGQGATFHVELPRD